MSSWSLRHNQNSRRTYMHGNCFEFHFYTNGLQRNTKGQRRGWYHLQSTVGGTWSFHAPFHFYEWPFSCFARMAFELGIPSRTRCRANVRRIDSVFDHLHAIGLITKFLLNCAWRRICRYDRVSTQDIYILALPLSNLELWCWKRLVVALRTRTSVQSFRFLLYSNEL